MDLILLTFYTYIFIVASEEFTIENVLVVIMISTIAWFMFVYWWLRK